MIANMAYKDLASAYGMVSGTSSCMELGACLACLENDVHMIVVIAGG